MIPNEKTNAPGECSKVNTTEKTSIPEPDWDQICEESDVKLGPMNADEAFIFTFLYPDGIHEDFQMQEAFVVREGFLAADDDTIKFWRGIAETGIEGTRNGMPEECVSHIRAELEDLVWREVWW